MTQFPFPPDPVTLRMKTKFSTMKLHLLCAAMLLLSEKVKSESDLDPSGTIRESRQQGIVNQLLTSIQGILGHTTPKTKTQQMLLEEEEEGPSVPTGTSASHGGVISHLLAAASGVSSGVLGVLGANTRPDPIPSWLQHQTTPKAQPFPSTIHPYVNLSSHSPNGGFFSQLNFPTPRPILDIVNGFLGQGSACSEIRKILGQCKMTLTDHENKY